MLEQRYTAIKALLLLLAVACNAEPLGLRTQARRGFFARQEALPTSPAPTGYPQAGVTPEVPFELPNEQSTTAKPNESYLPPDNTYGPPPEVDENPAAPPPQAPPLPPAVEDPESAEDAEIPQPQPDVKVQPVDAADADTDGDGDGDDDVVVQVAEDGSVIAVSTSFDQDAVVNEKSARLVYQRFPQQQQRRRKQPPTSEAFVERRPARLLMLRPVRLPAQGFAYTAQLQQW